MVAAEAEDGQRSGIAGTGRMNWRKATGYDRRAKVKASTGRCKQVIGDRLRFRQDNQRAIEIARAVDVLTRMPEPGRPGDVRTAWTKLGSRNSA
jgi:hypothetical protein